MFSYLIKKTFWDFIENFFLTIFLNLLLMIPLLLIGLSVFVFFPGQELDKIIPVTILAIMLYTTFAGVVSRYIRQVTAGKPYFWSDFFLFLKDSLLGGLIYGFILSGIGATFIFSTPYYFRMGGVMGAVGAAVTMWFVLLLFLAMFYYFPLTIRHGRKGSFKLSLVYFLNNLLWTPMQLFIILIIGLLSLATFGMFPGIATMISLLDNSVSLLDRKYDYIRKNNSDKAVPWKTLLREEKSEMSTKSVRKALFPFAGGKHED